MSQNHRANGWTVAKANAHRARIEPTLPALCVNGCGHLVYPEQLWEPGHLVDLALGGSVDGETGPAHRHCNRKAGGKLGARMTNDRKRAAARMRRW